MYLAPLAVILKADESQQKDFSVLACNKNYFTLAELTKSTDSWIDIAPKMKEVIQRILKLSNLSPIPS